MKKSFLEKLYRVSDERYSYGIALICTLIFSSRFLNVLPFSGMVRNYNSETIITWVSTLIYFREPFGFPLGSIQNLTYPFHDANIGNVGGIPLFGAFFKLLAQLIPYFQSFSYSVFVEILSCFTTAIFTQKILFNAGVLSKKWIALGALLTSTCALIFVRSSWNQPFCVVSFPLIAIWAYAMLLTTQDQTWNRKLNLMVILLFGLAALIDNYTLSGMLLGTGFMFIRELYEFFQTRLKSSKIRLIQLGNVLVGGILCGTLFLYFIGMFPLPSTGHPFTSYDFGMGGRLHDADLISFILPLGSSSGLSSLPARLGLNFNTDLLQGGELEGVSYLGTSALLIWIFLLIHSTVPKQETLAGHKLPYLRKMIWTSWTKLGFACFFVFLVSLGYELHVLGKSFPSFSGMPAAWIADRFNSFYNIRALGRLAPFLSVFLILEAIRRGALATRIFPKFELTLIIFLTVIHLVEVGPMLIPVPALPVFPVGGRLSQSEISIVKNLAQGKKAVLFAPGVLAKDFNWTIDTFSFAYYAEIPTNLFLVARSELSHVAGIYENYDKVLGGDWNALQKQYGKLLYVVPSDHRFVNPIDTREFQETKIGKLSIWQKIEAKTQ